VFGYFERVPVELIWWPREFAEASIAALLAGESSSSADALANGVALRTPGCWRRGKDASRRIRKGSRRHGSRRRR
jgi:hypothetical protein